MGLCVSKDLSGYLVVNESAECADYVLLTALEHEDLLAGSWSQFAELLHTLFVFSLEDFAYLHGYMIIAFVIGNGAGRVARWLGKA